MRKQSESRLYCKTIIILLPSSIAANDCCWNSLPIYCAMAYMWCYPTCRAFQTMDWSNLGRILRQQQIKVAFKPLKTVNSLFTRLKAQKKVDQATIWHSVQNDLSIAPTAVLYTMGKLNNHLKLGLQNTRELFLCLTTTLDKISCHVHMKTTTKWILEMSEFLY